MKEDTKQLETLSYEPICSICQKVSCQCRTVLLKENLAKPSSIKENTPIIEPKTASKQDKVADQPLEPNLKIIEEIEGLMAKVNEKLGKLEVIEDKMDKVAARRWTLKSQAFEEINLFETDTLFELRKAFE